MLELWLFVVRFMRFDACMFKHVCCFCGYWQLDLCIALGNSTDSKFKCVCSSYCFYADITIHDFCNTKTRITVTQEGTRVIKHSGRVSSIREGLTEKVLGYAEDTEG